MIRRPDTRCRSAPDRALATELRASHVLRVAVTLVVLAVLALAGCRKRTDDDRDDDRDYPIAERIVSFSPALTEIASTLGLGDAVVGVGTFDSWPPEVESLPRVGGMIDPNLELLVALQPDLVLTTPSVSGVETFVRERMPDTAVVSWQIDDVDQVREGFRKVARAAGRPELADVAVADFDERLAAHRVDAGDGDRPRVLVLVGRNPGEVAGLVAAGRNTYLDEALTLVGARNALDADAGEWPVLGIESVIATDPDVILELRTEPSADDPTAVWRASAPALSAVRDGRIAALDGPHLLVPGPRIPEVAGDLAQALERLSPAP